MGGGILLLLVAAAVLPATAQVVCRGDVNGDGFVTAADLPLLLQVAFDPDSASDATFAAADVNVDGDVTAADAVGVVILNGLECFPGASTPTPSRTRTPTPIGGNRTATPTPTRTATLGPTVACISQPLATGVTQGALTAADCQRVFRQDVRYADEYVWSGQAGQAVRIVVTANGFTPWVRIIDSFGHFEMAEGESPVELRAMTDLPYTILVSSEPGTEGELGSYTLSVTTRNCPTANLTTQNASLSGNECPAPWAPSFGSFVELADVYTFNVTTPLTVISITMRQAVEDSLLDPMLTVYGPNGYEVFPAFQADDLDLGGFGFDAFARFVAVETGTYTVVATGDHCDPTDVAGCGYRLLFSSTQCPRTALGTIPDTTRLARPGELFGNPLRTRCAAPLPIPGRDDLGVPEVGSPADFFTFEASAGDVITVEMESDDEPQVYIFGPASAGNPLVAVDDDRNIDLFARVGVTLPQAGTYTVVAANKNYLLPPDPFDLQDEGDVIEYTMYVQKCPIRGAVVPGAATVRNDTFNVLDCTGVEDQPIRSYAMSLDAGTFLDVTMESTSFNPNLTIVSPDGTRFTNDDDPFTPLSTTARVNRLVPVDGTYFLEATISPDELPGPGALSYSIRPRTCATSTVTPGLINGSLTDGDCDLGDGRRYDVLTYNAPADAATAPRAASLAGPADICVRPVTLTDTPLMPVTCGSQAIDIPVARTGPVAWMIVGATPARRGAYSLDFSQCPATLVGFGSSLSGTLTASDCGDALGRAADWFVFRGNTGLVRFAEGLVGNLTSTFPAQFSVAGADGRWPLSPVFGVDPDSFYPHGTNLVTLLKLTGETPTSTGAYGLSIEVPFRLQ